MKKTGLKGYVYDFSVDYDAIADIYIHKYLMKNNMIKKIFRFTKKVFVVKCHFLVVMH